MFDTEVYKENIDSFLNHSFNGGGTSITTVIKSIKKNGDNPSLIITDAFDTIRDYSPSVYILCVDEGSYNTLKQGNTPESKLFAQNNQILGFFNGQFKQ